MADVLIAGGGIAGSSLAILLGRRGFKVELYERKTFPREKTCGEGLMPAGVAVLRRLGLAQEAGGAHFFGIRYHFGSRSVEGAFPDVQGISVTGLGQRRWELDRLLFETAAKTPGVRAHPGVRVEAPLLDQGRVTGLLIEGATRRAPLVVAADGNHSVIRRALGLDVPVRRRRLGLRTHFQLSEGHEPIPWVEVFVNRGYELYVTPLPRRQLLVAALAEADKVAGAAESNFERWWRAEPALASKLRGAAQITAVSGVYPLAARARRGVGPGVVLLGDAAGFVDPITGGGMTQALMSAELLDRHLPDSLGNPGDWLLQFERARHWMLRDYHMITGALLWVAQYPALAQRIFSILGARPKLFSHLIGIPAGVRGLFGNATAGS